MGKCAICGKETSSYRYICNECAEEQEAKPYGRYCDECGADMFDEDHKEGCGNA
jgi:predicted amidophosphoribosyltransferase